ncbi:C6 zinc finger domain containing protein [Lasiodiplodia theobromae]|uniref:C6 zinc finger domain containing protein n=1 Tax=Lasiodiplodia theobromae TaxID=45133 RepID=UPI0015C32DCE|nr:C6 zinc finger domain containing protein [Lasiodiplodia theobromae]KAF4535125.1 C6 zinc finger domain containing protein [Lasiodiplodia theobromae]
MPRRKASERSLPHKSRSRNGCLTCRKRKIRCDEGKPVCSNCRDKALQCLRGVTLKWEQEYASRGLAFGRSGVWSKNGSAHDDSPRLDSAVVHWLPLPHIQSYHFVNSTIEGFEESLAEQEELSWFSAKDDAFLASPGRPGSSSSSLSGYSQGGAMVPFGMHSPIMHASPSAVLLSPSEFPQLENPTYAPLLEYYIQRVCPLTTPSVLSNTPFASLILPFSVHASSTALNSVLALSARHLSKSNRAWKSIAMQLEGKVLHSLRRRLMTEDPERVALDPEVPTIMMMLCLYEIINKCDERWVIHLHGARDLIRTRRRLLCNTTPNNSSNSNNDLLNFSERFFAFQDVIGRTACGEVPIFGEDYWDASDVTADAWLGCSPELVSVICSITELSRQRRHRCSRSRSRSRSTNRKYSSSPSSSPSSVGTFAENDRDSFALEAAALESRLNDIHQLVPDADNDAALHRSAEAKRLAAIVYLYCALYGATPATPLVVTHVRQILQLVHETVSSTSDSNMAATTTNAAGLTWPLFVAAVELDPLNDELWVDERTGQMVYGRPLVLRAFNQLAKGSISNVVRTREVVSKVWEMREKEMVVGSPAPREEVEGDEAERNDWERCVAPLSINMSLVG